MCTTCLCIKWMSVKESIVYKDLSLVWGIDRKLHPEDHCLASRSLPSDATLWLRGADYKDLSVEKIEKSVQGITIWHHDACRWCQTVIARDGVFCLPLTPMIDSFACTPFISKRRIFNYAATSIADVRHIVMTLLWRLMTSLRSVT